VRACDYTRVCERTRVLFVCVRACVRVRMCMRACEHNNVYLDVCVCERVRAHSCIICSVRVRVRVSKQTGTLQSAPLPRRARARPIRAPRSGCPPHRSHLDSRAEPSLLAAARSITDPAPYPRSWHSGLSGPWIRWSFVRDLRSMPTSPQRSLRHNPEVIHKTPRDSSVRAEGEGTQEIPPPFLSSVPLQIHLTPDPYTHTKIPTPNSNLLSQVKLHTTPSL
jgi:hypothetical protein